MSARTPGIEMWMKHYADFGRAELRVEMERVHPDFDRHRAAAIMLDELDRREREEEDGRHREIMRVTKIGAAVATVGALAAIAAAWYAKSQADSAAISSRASLSTTPQPQATPVTTPQKSTSAPAPAGTAVAPTKAPQP